MAQDEPTKISGRYEKFLTPEEAGPIFDEAARQSVYQQLIPRIDLSWNGVKIPFTTEKATAKWVGEGERKPTTEGGLDLMFMEPKKIAAISVMSKEFARADPAQYSRIIRNQIAEAIAVAFDQAVAFGVDSPFDTALSDTDKTQALGEAAANKGGVWKDLNGALSQLVTDKKKLTGWALDTVTEPLLNSSVDANGRPLFVESPYDGVNASIRPGNLMGRRAFLGEGVQGPDGVVGYAGDWSKARWGAIGGISWDVSTQASVTINGELVSLFENNLIAVLAEAEYGFIVGDKDAFVKLTSKDDTGS